MSKLDDWEQFVENLENPSPEQKLALIDIETRVSISTIKGFAQIMKLKVDPSTPNLPEGFFDWLDQIIENVEYVDRVLELARPSSNARK